MDKNEMSSDELEYSVTELDIEDIDGEFDPELLATKAELGANISLAYYKLEDLEKEELIELCRFREKELGKFKYHYTTALEQLDIARRQLADYKMMYESVSGSTVWKLTLPIRLLLDLIKWPFRAHLLRKIGKFFKHARKYGLKSAFAKVREKKNEHKHSKTITHTITAERRAQEMKASFSQNVKFSILVPLYNTPLNFLEEMIDSVSKQTYQNWELCLADGSDAEHEEVGRTCLRLAKHDDRIKYQKLTENRGISDNTNACLDMATGNYIALFDHDDILHPSALYEMMRVICDEGADYVYTDEATFESPDITKITSIHYKPDFAPDNLRANNYICHFSAFKTELLEKSGRFRRDYDGSQDHDLILRLTANAKRVVHIPKILYFWRSHPASVAMDINSKKYAIDAGKNAVRSSIDSLGMKASVESTKVFPAMYRIKYDVSNTAKVSIIISGVKNDKQLERCVNKICERTSYGSYEIIVSAPESDKKIVAKASELESMGKLKLITSDSESVAKLLNLAASSAVGEHLVFLDGGCEILSNRWLEELLMYSQRDDVGPTAGILYYPDNTVRHAGYVVGNGKSGIAARLFYRIHNTSVGYMGRLWYSQNLSAVSSEMMMVKKSLFTELCGFDEKFGEFYYDVDFCLRAREAGKLVVFTPYAAAYVQSVAKIKHRDDLNTAKQDAKRMLKLWDNVLSEPDPYYNKNFSKEYANFSL